MLRINSKGGKQWDGLVNPYFATYITGKFLFGVGLGILLAIWLPTWTGWVFIGIALLIGIPSARIIRGGKRK